MYTVQQMESILETAHGGCERIDEDLARVYQTGDGRLIFISRKGEVTTYEPTEKNTGRYEVSTETLGK